MPVRVQLSRRKGWRMPPNTVSVARPTKWGNPFVVGCNPSQFSAALPSHCDSVAEAVQHYRYFAQTWIDLTRGNWVSALRGMNLACWCPLTDKDGNRVPCHADVLLELANKDLPHEH